MKCAAFYCSIHELDEQAVLRWACLHLTCDHARIPPSLPPGARTASYACTKYGAHTRVWREARHNHYSLLIIIVNAWDGKQSTDLYKLSSECSWIARGNEMVSNPATEQLTGYRYGPRNHIEHPALHVRNIKCYRIQR